MNQTLNQVLRMMVLRAQPQDLPGNKAFALAVAAIYILTAAMALAAIGEPHLDLAISTDLATTVAIVWLALRLTGHTERVPQTLAATFACGSVFNSLAVPVLSATQVGARGQLNADSLVTLAWWALLLWSLWVNGHILRHALEMKLSAGIVLATLMFIASTLAYGWSVGV